MRLPTVQATEDGTKWKEYDGDYSLPTMERFIAPDRFSRRNVDGKSIEISTSKKMKEIIESKEPWFVKFYAPWCGHCKNLAPVWETMAEMLKDKVNVAEVNCEDKKALCSEYKVTGLPTLAYFVHGASNLKYNGPRKLKELMDYAVHMSGSPVHPIDSDEKLTDVLKENDVSLVYVRDTDDHKIDSYFEETVAPQFMETVPFYTTNNKETIERFGLSASSLPAAVLVKDGTYVVYSGKDKQRDWQHMVQWLEQEQHPLITRVLGHNSNQILRWTDALVVLGMVGADGRDAEAESKLRQMAQLYKEEYSSLDKSTSKRPVLFAQMDGKLWEHYISRVYGLHSYQLPALIILDPKHQVYYDRHANDEPFSFVKDRPESLLKSLQALDSLKGTSMAPSKVMMKVDRVLTYFGDHWILMTTVLVGFLGVFFYLITRDTGHETETAKVKKVLRDASERTAAAAAATAAAAGSAGSAGPASRTITTDEHKNKKN
ncbi:hypothetical protein BDF20DRAFT_551479 [Mycotypha africana]|uniref:uncharacterized protein n=1 Tax=Mycotypha africana TaxID=64632 RepID=UPI002301B3D1|nr:uncharacterized protein BDF20DRAFT_551479 [Mycotypha africana]KAI8977210.1 hypothetical protein BDF20DRAFT_551479 [Mycotypha africana]